MKIIKWEISQAGAHWRPEIIVEWENGKIEAFPLDGDSVFPYTIVEASDENI